MSPIEKPCIFCKESCAGLPRIKDPEGRYAHKACAENAQSAQQAQSAQAQPPVASLDLSHDDEPEMAAFLDDLPGPDDAGPVESSGLRMACPGCGSSISSESTVCMSCGCNVKTGKGIKTKVVKQKEVKAGSGIGAKAGSLTLASILPIIGASIGGVIGAAIWLAVQIFTGYEIGLLAAGVGALCGVGAALFSHGGNAWAGGVAVVVALISVFLGKILIATMFIAGGDMMRAQIQSEMIEPFTTDSLTQDLIFEQLVIEVVQDHYDQNTAVEWPDGEPAEDPYWPYDYSDEIVEETRAHWDAMIPEDQLAYKELLVGEFNVDILEWNRELEDELAELDNFKLSELFTFWDILWAFLAVGAAWQCGNGED